MKSKQLGLLITGLLLASGLAAAEVRVVRFLVQQDFNPPPCVSFAGWASETFFHNSTDVVQTVRFLGVSNGNVGPNPKSLSVPPHQTVEIPGDDSLGWSPAGARGAVLWVNRLDVPPGVIVANRVTSTVDDVGTDPTRLPCTGKQTEYAGLPLPVFGALTAAGTTQYFLGTDVGTEPAETGTRDARLNIGVYNGGAVAAVASVRIYCGQKGPDLGFPNSLVLAEQVQVPADSVIQKTVLSSTSASSCPVVGFWYATVTVDQPSFAYAIALANGTLPTFPGTVALTYTGN